ncbi:UNVERIFIED_CONTAM: hypothetical protein FKN15_028944 [Acipenser sinensis]
MAARRAYRVKKSGRLTALVSEDASARLRLSRGLQRVFGQCDKERRNLSCKSTSRPGRELDVVNQRVTFLPLEENIEGHAVLKRSNIYQIQLRQVNHEEWSVSISTLCSEGWDSDGVIYPKLAWLSTELLSKLAKWSTENKKSEFKSTLSLIAVEKYSHLYQQLKEKYKEMVKVWPEVTDPEKFVYEDVAIATYLLVMWEEERKEKDLAEKQSFVDLGCGNGLLVHILSNEGECAITPSENFLFPDVDWLIGNHSDELTPWIPVMSSRSSYSCRFFVLPCCFFDFIGKYNRRQCKKTQYREYIDFIAEVASVCGFDVEEDCLRIPSTKRVCLVGSLSVREVAELLDKETLQNLKNECGGLQTLLKNNHQVFRVLGGIVQIRDWREETGGRKAKPDLKRKLSSAVLKTRLCWFFVNHPDGCPIPSESCLFAHGPEELRPSAFKSSGPKPDIGTYSEIVLEILGEDSPAVIGVTGGGLESRMQRAMKPYAVS